MSEVFDSLLNIANVQALIAGGVRESQNLEYKTAADQFPDGAKKEIAKDVSAMANSGGGTIIYGVETSDKNDKTRPTGIQAIHPTNIETFDKVVNSQVRPPVNWAKRLLPTTEDPQVMIVDIRASEDPPHQSLYDYRYYRRSGTESKPMEHDLVALHFGRRLGPMLTLKIQSLGNPTGADGNPAFSQQARLRFLIENTGRRAARFTSLIVKFPPATIVRIAGHSGPVTNIDALYPGLQARQFDHTVGVIHSKMMLSMFELGLEVSRAFIVEHPIDPFITWIIHADDMNPTEGETSLRDFGWA